MADPSKSKFSINPGGNAQAMEMNGTKMNVEVLKCMTDVGTKRSAKERLGKRVDDSVFHSKRQRGDSNVSNLSSNALKDLYIGKDDLRYKIMQKTGVQKDDERNVVDLREKITRIEQSHSFTNNTWPHISELSGTGILGKFPPNFISSDLQHSKPVRIPYPVWTLDQLRRKSPDRIHRSSSDTLWPKFTGPSESVNYASPPISQIPPSGDIVQKSSYMAGQLATVDSFLDSLGLGNYNLLFKAEEVDMTTLKQMRDDDLKDIGIPMGARNKILLALVPRSKVEA